jgi:hypothetical protein
VPESTLCASSCTPCPPPSHQRFPIPSLSPVKSQTLRPTRSNFSDCLKRRQSYGRMDSPPHSAPTRRPVPGSGARGPRRAPSSWRWRSSSRSLDNNDLRFQFERAAVAFAERYRLQCFNGRHLERDAKPIRPCLAKQHSSVLPVKMITFAVIGAHTIESGCLSKQPAGTSLARTSGSV